MVVTQDEYRPSTLKTISYGSAWFTDGMVYTIFGVTVFYFYEVEVGLNILLLTIAYAIYAVWNMLNDPLLSYLTERPRSESSVMKWGFRTLWILFFLLIMALVFFFIYFIPDFSTKTNQIGIFLYMLIMICSFDAVYSIYNAHFAGGAYSLFRTDEERQKLAAVSTLASTLGVFFINVVILPMVIDYGNQSSFAVAAAMTSLLMVINFLVLIYGAKEPEEIKRCYLVGRSKELNECIPMKKIIKSAFTKKSWIVALISWFFWNIGFNLTNASSLYVYKDVLQVDYGFSMFPNLAFFIMFLIGLPITLKLSKKVGHHNLYGVGYMVIGVAFFAYIWVGSWPEMVIYMSIGGFAYALIGASIVAVSADANDEVTAELGVHQEGTLQGISYVIVRITYMLVGLFIALIHVLTDYSTDVEALQSFLANLGIMTTFQSDLAILGVRIHAGVIPGIFTFLAGILFLVLFDMKGEKKERIQAILKEKMSKGTK